MTSILKESGIKDFPLEKRKKTLFSKTNIIICAYQNKCLVGYLDYLRDFENPENIYLSSIQILPNSRGGTVFKKLIYSLRNFLELEDFTYLKSDFQISNTQMRGIFTSLGFELEENSSRGSISVKISKNRIFKKTEWLKNCYL